MVLWEKVLLLWKLGIVGLLWNFVGFEKYCLFGLRKLKIRRFASELCVF